MTFMRSHSSVQLRTGCTGMNRLQVCAGALYSDLDGSQPVVGGLLSLVSVQHCAFQATYTDLKFICAAAEHTWSTVHAAGRTNADMNAHSGSAMVQLAETLHTLSCFMHPAVP